MSSPLIWIFLPILFSVALFLTKSKRLLCGILGTFFSLVLAVAATYFPKDFILGFGSNSLEVKDIMVILGRTLTITYDNLTLVSIIFYINAFWNLGSCWFKTNKFFPAMSLVITPLLVAALAVEPFLYAALFIEIIILISIPLLSPETEKTTKGILRYLVFQFLAFPFILFAGWALSGAETAPANSPLINQATISLIIGFLLLLAIIPFHSWLPLLTESAHPWMSSYFLILLPSSLLLFMLTFLDRYAWLRSLEGLYPTFRFIGTSMIALGGALVLFQKNLGKAFGYSVIIETGFSLLCFGLNELGGMYYFSMLLLPRMIGYWLWAFCLGKIKDEYGSLEFSNLPALMHEKPFLSGGLIIAQLSIAGIPMLAGFPVKRMIWFIAAQPDLVNALWIFLGTMGIYIFTFKVMVHMIKSEDAITDWKVTENLGIIIPILLIVGLTIFAGIFPHLLLPRFTGILDAFPRFPITP